jgi:GMC oxidoreductase
MPLTRLIHSFDDDAVALWNANLDQGMTVAKSTNAKEAWPARGPVIPTTHLHGGTIMGTGAENSVTNSYGQTHEIANLWMAALASSRPKAPRIQPTLFSPSRFAAPSISPPIGEASQHDAFIIAPRSEARRPEAPATHLIVRHHRAAVRFGSQADSQTKSTFWQSANQWLS